jgi:hypothetical protein
MTQKNKSAFLTAARKFKLALVHNLYQQQVVVCSYQQLLTECQSHVIFRMLRCFVIYRRMKTVQT